MKQNKSINPVEVEVNVTLTLSKTFTIISDDYLVEDTTVDEDYYTTEKLKFNNLKGDFINQKVLPTELPLYIESMFKEDVELKLKGIPKYMERAIRDNKDWQIEELNVEEA